LQNYAKTARLLQAPKPTLDVRLPRAAEKSGKHMNFMTIFKYVADSQQRRLKSVCKPTENYCKYGQRPVPDLNRRNSAGR
jgi:hypothetical protein